MSTITELKVSPSGSLARGVTTIVFERTAEIVDQLRAAEEEQFEATDVCLDFAEIDTVSSADLSALIRFSLRVRRLDKSISMSNVSPPLEAIFEITRFGVWSTS